MRYRRPTVEALVAALRRQGFDVPAPWSTLDPSVMSDYQAQFVNGWLAELRYYYDPDKALDRDTHLPGDLPWRGLRADTLLHGVEQHWDTQDIAITQILNLSPADCAPLDRAQVKTHQELVAQSRAKVEFRRTLRTLLALAGVQTSRHERLAAI